MTLPKKNLFDAIYPDLSSDQKKKLALHFQELLNSLSDIEAYVISQRYDCAGGIQNTFSRIAENTSKSNARIQQIHERSIGKLRSIRLQRLIQQILEVPLESESIEELSVDVLNLSVRAQNCLKNAEVQTVGELIKRTESLLKTKRCGPRSLNEIRKELSFYGLSLKKESPPEEKILTSSSINNSTPIEYLGLTIKSLRYQLRESGIRTLGDLLEKSAWDLLGIEKIGLNSLEEIRKELSSLGRALKFEDKVRVFQYRDIVSSPFHSSPKSVLYYLSPSRSEWCIAIPSKADQSQAFYGYTLVYCRHKTTTLPAEVRKLYFTANKKELLLPAIEAFIRENLFDDFVKTEGVL